ncbi:MAG: glycoside hydrolase family 3 N-terminal domain-containing protein [Thermoleophilaceae bacterium]
MLGGLALVALVIGVLLGAGGGSGTKAPPRARAAAKPPPSPEDVAGRLIVVRFDGPALPTYVRDALRHGRAAGVILFRDNVTSESQTRALSAGVQRAAGGRALIATDQEGGAIRTLPYVGSAVGQGSQSTPEEAAAAAREIAGGLKRVGVNVDLAPIADMAGPGPLMAGRAFAGSPASVSARLTAALKEYERAGVAATAKHFPGLGRATANTDDTSVAIAARRADLAAADLIPFKAAVAAGVPLVMASHASYPAYGSAIASQSPQLLRGVLRQKLGFKGVVVTDSIEAQAVLARSSLERAAVRSVRGGSDLILTTGSGSYIRVYRALVRAAKRSPVFRKQMNSAAARVTALQSALAKR